ncbi:hypothetical protein D9757_003402 [Collybiopsis confluens]|uniref:GmrSD restriction endonucleases N-terminal domain-containing protein n=1 Tax=Collybiopsis confluens TaxID=2823264 RepID=A0A8H5HTG1_9AGAR|nr:hypothetical protein D9757_003402 [Collybiopsis confluens]
MSSSEFSDVYDEPEDSDSELQPTFTKSSQQKKSQEHDYRLQRSLKPPRATTYTAKALYEQIYSSDVNLSPEYQRDVVWTQEKQTNLIDSIYRNFYIPPIIFAVTVEDDGSEHRTCIDGKQRLTSIQLFMDGLIPHRDSMTGQKYWFKNVDSSKFKRTGRRQLLPNKLRTTFSNKQIVCVEYSELTDLDERDIFKRVQQGMALTPSEKLSVLSTARTVFIRKLLSTYVTDETLGKLNWDTARGADVRVFSHAVFCMELWIFNPDEVKSHGTLQQVEKWLAGAEDFTKDIKAQIRETYDIYVKIATSSKYREPLFAYKKVSPLEMIFIPLLIFIHGVIPPSESRLSLKKLSMQISDLRSFVRKNNTDVRMNARVGKSMMEYIKQLEPEPTSKTFTKNKRQREDGDIEHPSVSSYPHSTSQRTLPTPETSTLSSVSSADEPGSKRKKMFTS